MRRITWKWTNFCEHINRGLPPEAVDPDDVEYNSKVPLIEFWVQGVDAGIAWRNSDGTWMYLSDHFEADGDTLQHAMGALADTFDAILAGKPPP